MKCEQCGVEIAEDKVAMPNRCVDWRCPTMPAELRWKQPCRAKNEGGEAAP